MNIIKLENIRIHVCLTLSEATQFDKSEVPLTCQCL